MSGMQQVEATVGKNQGLIVLAQLLATNADIRKNDLFLDRKHALNMKFVLGKAMFFTRSVAYV
jgi:hypothetical protein